MSNLVKELENAGLIKSGRLIFYASDIPAWLGHSPFESPFSILEKRKKRKMRKLKGKKVIETVRMREGKEIKIYRMRMGEKMEGHIIDVVAKRTGISLVDRKKWQVFFSKDFSEYKGIKIGLGGRVDALGERIEIIGEDIVKYEYVIEVKHMRSYAAQEIEKEIPSWYLDQILGYAYLHQRGVIFGARCKDDYVVKIIEYYELESGIQKMLEGLNEMARLIIDGDKEGMEKFCLRAKEERIKEAMIDKKENFDYSRLEYGDVVQSVFRSSSIDDKNKAWGSLSKGKKDRIKEAVEAVMDKKENFDYSRLEYRDVVQVEAVIDKKENFDYSRLEYRDVVQVEAVIDKKENFDYSRLEYRDVVQVEAVIDKKENFDYMGTQQNMKWDSLSKEEKDRIKEAVMDKKENFDYSRLEYRDVVQSALKSISTDDKNKALAFVDLFYADSKERIKSYFQREALDYFSFIQFCLDLLEDLEKENKLDYQVANKIYIVASQTFFAFYESMEGRVDSSKVAYMLELLNKIDKKRAEMWL